MKQPYYIKAQISNNLSKLAIWVLKTNQLPLHPRTQGVALPLYIKQSLQGVNLCSSNSQCLLLLDYLSLKVTKNQLWLTRLISRPILQAQSGMNEEPSLQ